MPEHQGVRNLNRKISQESLLEIIRRLGIQDQTRIDKLEGQLRDLHRCAQHIEHWAAVGRSRRDQIEWLRDLRKHIAKVDQHLQHSDRLTRLTLGHALAPSLASMLRREGMTAVYPPANQFVGLDSREQDRSSSRGGDRSRRVPLGPEHDPASERFAQDHVVDLARGLLRGLDEPLAAVLEAEKLSPRAKGGRRPEPRRAAVIDECAKIFESIGKTPTAKEGGEFVVFCASVLDVLGLPEAGVREAIIRNLSPA